MNPADPDPFIEKPLTGPAKWVLAAAAAGVILLFYLFVLGSVLALLLLLLVELCLVVVLARFGLASIMVRVMNEHGAPLPVFLQSLRIRKPVEFRIWLKAEDAPGLFGLLRQLSQRVQVHLPHAVALEMSSGAWVQLKGYRRGGGRTVLGIGYDLLAGLSDGEIEAVLAHEMMHAKLVQRGFNNLLRGGLSRAVQLAGGLSGQVEAARRARRSVELTKTFFAGADWFARQSARLVASCSRQDEFAADSGAASVSAPGMLQSALLRLQHIDRNASRLPWRERVAQLQSGAGFGDWLRKELCSVEHATPGELKAELRSKYSTHPSLKDRLAALPPCAALPQTLSGRPGIELLAHPDKVAENLVAEIQRVMAREEQKDSKQLDRWNRKLRSSSHLRPIQSLGLVVAACGIIIGPIVCLTVGMSAGLAGFVALTVIPGVLCYRFGGYRERLKLPIPDFSLIKTAWQSNTSLDPAKLKPIEAELRERCGSLKSRSQRARFLAREGCTALERCNYLRAHAAATLALAQDNKSVEAQSVLGISAAAFRQFPQVQSALREIQKATRFTGASAAWAAAWILLLCGDWNMAEAMLAEARKGRPEDPTLLALLAIAQVRRGKLQSAIGNVRRACNPRPRNKEYAKLLISLLLDAGLFREARELLAPLETELRLDPELAFSMLRMKLLCRQFAELDEWEVLWRKHSTRAYDLVRLGSLYEGARMPEKASNCYYEALASAHFPSAFLGLARLAFEGKSNAEAERHLLAVLNLSKPIGDGDVGPLQLFGQVFVHLLSLQEPALNCRAWIATLPGSGVPPPVAKHSLVIYAKTRPEAEQSLAQILSAMQPAAPPLLPHAVVWRAASRQQQPDGPVRPGVQGFM